MQTCIKERSRTPEKTEILCSCQLSGKKFKSIKKKSNSLRPRCCHFNPNLNQPPEALKTTPFTLRISLMTNSEISSKITGTSTSAMLVNHQEPLLTPPYGPVMEEDQLSEQQEEGSENSESGSENNSESGDSPIWEGKE